MNPKQLMDEILNRPNPAVRKRALQQIYFPLMFKDSPEEFNLRWINEIAMSPHLPVDVVDDHNTILYTIPPLRRTSDLVKREDATALNAVLTHAVAEGGRSHLHQENFMREYEGFMVKFVTVISMTDIEGWIHALTDCGFGDKVKDVKVVTAKQEEEDNFVEGEPDEW